MIAEAMTDTVLLILTLEQFFAFMEDSVYKRGATHLVAKRPR
jgi:hypothetical protein